LGLYDLDSMEYGVFAVQEVQDTAARMRFRSGRSGEIYRSFAAAGRFDTPGGDRWCATITSSLRAFCEVGYAPQVVSFGEFNQGGGYRATRDVLDASVRPTAIWCSA
jgi:hypothetical protein